MTARPRNSNKTSFSRDAWLEINLNSLEHNYKEIREQIRPTSQLMAVVKSDAYGHGASVTTPLLEACGVEYFGVASVDEGIQLRDAGVKSSILVLSPTPSWALVRAITNNLEITISNLEQVKDLEKIIKRNPKRINAPIDLQIKVNTGMNRNGSKWNKYASQLIQYVLDNKSLFKLTGVFSHFACGENDFFSQVQLDRFENVIKQFKRSDLGLLHIDASPSICNGQVTHFDMVRVGLSLYGLGNYGRLNLKTCMSLIARVSQLQEVHEGEGVGYGLTWRAEKDSLIALLPLGYADGIKRGLSNRIKAIYKDNFINQVGTISMDQITVDLSAFHDQVKVGDLVILIGDSERHSIKISDWSQILNTIDYEVACDLRARLPRVYVRK
ncbi:MAG: alanine racemase [Candidatus Caenarcaniphilales bacterium]|nr:alanine racemase [Candidatus Caenarcaniphilales bacterium]